MVDNPATAGLGVEPGSAAELIQLSTSDKTYSSLDRFTIDKRIGKGQFSVVYRARCRHDNTPVALKKVQIFEMMDSKARLDCMKEIQLLQVGCRLFMKRSLPK